MNVMKYKRDLEILKKNYDIHDRQGKVIKYGIDWNNNPSERWVLVRRVKLPYPRTNLKETNVKIMVPENLYDPASGGGYHFYQHIYVDPNLRIFHPRRKQYVYIPHHYKRDRKNWSYICIHPSGIVKGNKTILDFIRLLQIYLKNVDPDSL